MTALTVLVTWTPHTEPPPFRELSAPEQRIAASWPAWRQQEWTAARLTARAALHLTWGTLPASVTIPRAPDGAPDLQGAPRATTLSLTHTWSHPPGTDRRATLVTACAVRADPAHPVGVDLEHVSAAIGSLIPRIAPTCRQRPGPYTATALWACKEAAFKACRQPTAHMSDFDVRAHAGTVTITPAPHLRLEPLTAWPTRLRDLVLVSAGPDLPRPRLLCLTASDALTLTTATEGAYAP